MYADLSNFKVIYDNKVLRALYLEEWDNRGEPLQDGEQEHFKSISVVALNEEGQFISIKDDARKFQFIPVIK